MSIKPIEIAMIQNTHAPSQQAQADDTKGAMMMNQGSITTNKEAEHTAQSVQNKEDADGGAYSFAGGDGKRYSNNNGSVKKKNGKSKLPDGSVRIKGSGSGFNITI